MQSVRIYEMPPCKMASSAPGMFGDGPLEKFDAWFSTLSRPMFPRDFLWFDRAHGGFVWYYMLEEGMSAPEEFETIDFPGGLYAVATDIDGQDDRDPRDAVRHFLAETNCFEIDPSREELGNVITSPRAQAALGYNQMDYFTPIRTKEDAR